MQTLRVPAAVSVSRRENSPNLFRVGPSSKACESATLWLSPEFVDLEQKIEIQGRSNFNGFVAASRRILLEDVRTRADRKHPFWAKVMDEGQGWQVVE